MTRIVFLVEEPSMVELLRAVLPKVFPGWVEGQHWLALAHQGKSDLEKSVPRKLRAWNRPEDRFVIMRDNDGGDCRAHKARLVRLAAAQPSDRVLVRIVCQELESWFLGDLPAIKKAFPVAVRHLAVTGRRYQDPDQIINASQELGRLTEIPGKVGRAREISACMAVEDNLSNSFRVFVSGLKRLVSGKSRA
jgi:Domain of unknown function (DUF4276)